MDINIVITNARYQCWETRKYSYVKVPRPDFGILLLVKGKMDYILDGKVIELRPLDVIFLPKDSRYEVRIHTEEEPVENLLVNFLQVGSQEERLPVDPFFQLHDSAKVFLSVMEKIVETYQNGGSQILLAKSCAYSCLYQLILATNKKEEAVDLIEKAKILLVDKKDYSIEEIAHGLLMSYSGFRRKFKEKEGISPARFRQNRRIEEAKGLLVSTDLSVNAIAAYCNFYDTAYFCKVFEREMGMTPGKYRNSVAQY